MIMILLPGKPQPLPKPHRVPLGLLMLSRGLVGNDQLRQALKAQKDAGGGRIGEWLRHIGAVNEEQVTRTLGVQWSIPFFPLGESRRYLECARLVPFSLLEAAQMVPVHHLPTTQHLYVAFTERINYSALYAIEKMLDCRTEPCLAEQSLVIKAINELRLLPRPVEMFTDRVCDPADMAHTIAAHFETLGGTDVRVSGIEGFIWARVLARDGYTDVLFQLPRSASGLLGQTELDGQ